MDGVAHEKLCPDGLVFDPTIRKINKCDQPFNADCGDRTELRKYNWKKKFNKILNFSFKILEPAKSSRLCPRRNGFFAHPEPHVCNIFYNCIEGEATEIQCTAGLHFDEYTGTCVWPDAAGRQGCDNTKTRKESN